MVTAAAAGHTRLGPELAEIAQGLRWALALITAATLVRCVLVAATMTLLGRANWWAPAPLRRLHRRFGLQESSGHSGRGAGTAPRGAADLLPLA